MKPTLMTCCVVLAALFAHGRLNAAERLEFNRMVAHWTDYANPDYLTFLAEAQPQVVQVGFYGAHFWSLAHTEHGKGYPAHFPVVGLTEQGVWFANLNAQIHKTLPNAKVIGHFNVMFLVGDYDSPDGPRGFFKFYKDLWDTKLLGPKPVDDPIDLLEIGADGKPIVNTNYSIGGMKEHGACQLNPQWQAVLKAWVKVGIERGLDGFVLNYFYRHDCRCEHCVAGFKKYLGERFKPAELKEKFEISDLKGHTFTEIVSWHDPKESTPLRREMLRFSQIATKNAADEVFIKYGRSLKPDLIVAQWDHLGNFGQISGDERCMLPKELWGKGEDYLWYSTGGAACFTDLAEGFLGDGTLQARYIRGAFDDKPFTLGKYESTRIRSAIAEMAANGGAAMGFYTNFTVPQARAEIVRYYGFLKRYDDIYHANRPYAEAALLYPRSKVHEGEVSAVDSFKQLGRQLLDEHVLFDVIPDDLATEESLKAYTFVIKPTEAVVPAPGHLSRFAAPQTVRVSASMPEKKDDELAIHFVNYNRTEPAEKRSAGTGIADEKPIAVKDVRAELHIPKGTKLTRVEAMSPESPEPVELKHELKDGRVVFTMPEFLVYSVARIKLEPAPE